MGIYYKEITCAEELEESRVLRHHVFVEEQGVPSHLERDALDDTSFHIIAVRGEIVGTGRITIHGETAKISRLAVEKGHRRQSIGETIVKALEKIAHSEKVSHIELSSNLESIPFYEALGYVKRGTPFIECGGKVQKMVK